MLESWPVALLTGTVLGTLSGLGVGGGSLLILWLTLVLGMDPETARGINLLFFLPAACAASFFRWRQGALRFRAVLPAVAAGCAAAVLFSWVQRRLDLSLLRRMFGCLLILTGLRELFYRPKEE